MQAGTWGHVELTGIADLVKECVSACTLTRTLMFYTLTMYRNTLCIVGMAIISGGFRGLQRKLGRACALEHYGVWRLACIGSREDGAEYGNGWQQETNIYARYIVKKPERW